MTGYTQKKDMDTVQCGVSLSPLLETTVRNEGIQYMYTRYHIHTYTSTYMYIHTHTYIPVAMMAGSVDGPSDKAAGKGARLSTTSITYRHKRNRFKERRKE